MPWKLRCLIGRVRICGLRPIPFTHHVFVDGRLFFLFILSAMLGKLLLSKCLQGLGFHRCPRAILLLLIEILASLSDFLPSLPQPNIDSSQVTHRVRQCYRVESAILKTLYVGGLSEFLKNSGFVRTSFIELILRSLLSHLRLLLQLLAVAEDSFQTEVELLCHATDCGS